MRIKDIRFTAETRTDLSWNPFELYLEFTGDTGRQYSMGQMETTADGTIDHRALAYTMRAMARRLEEDLK